MSYDEWYKSTDWSSSRYVEGVPQDSAEGKAKLRLKYDAYYSSAKVEQEQYRKDVISYSQSQVESGKGSEVIPESGGMTWSMVKDVYSRAESTPKGIVIRSETSQFRDEGLRFGTASYNLFTGESISSVRAESGDVFVNESGKTIRPIAGSMVTVRKTQSVPIPALPSSGIISFTSKDGEFKTVDVKKSLPITIIGNKKSELLTNTQITSNIRTQFEQGELRGVDLFKATGYIIGSNIGKTVTTYNIGLSATGREELITESSALLGGNIGVGSSNIIQSVINPAIPFTGGTVRIPVATIISEWEKKGTELVGRVFNINSAAMTTLSEFYGWKSFNTMLEEDTQGSFDFGRAWTPVRDVSSIISVGIGDIIVGGEIIKGVSPSPVTPKGTSGLTYNTHTGTYTYDYSKIIGSEGLLSSPRAGLQVINSGGTAFANINNFKSAFIGSVSKVGDVLARNPSFILQGSNIIGVSSAAGLKLSGFGENVVNEREKIIRDITREKSPFISYFPSVVGQQGSIVNLPSVRRENINVNRVNLPSAFSFPADFPSVNINRVSSINSNVNASVIRNVNANIFVNSFETDYDFSFKMPSFNIPILPVNLGLGSGVSFSGKFLKSKSSKTKYTPSLLGIVGGFKSFSVPDDSKVWSGLEIRPMIVTYKKKKKRKG